MADYYSPTVVDPRLPVSDMTPLEFLVLEQLFSHDLGSEGVYYYAEIWPGDTVEISVPIAKAALEASRTRPSRLSDRARETLRHLKADETWLEFDFSVEGWGFIFQDIIQRSPSVEFVAIQSAFTCSKMRPDGFGGSATVITAKAIRSKSTDDIIQELLDELKPDTSQAGSSTPGLPTSPPIDDKGSDAQPCPPPHPVTTTVST